MGLDMYLTAKLGMYETDKDKRLPKLRKMFPAIFKSGNLNFIKVEFEAGYWRKANQIHKWFVDNVQEGNDNCGEYYVSREDLRKLLGICKELKRKLKLKKGKVINGYRFENGKRKPILEDGEIIANPKIAEKLLPVHQGFFFGSYEYDDWYLSKIKNTIKIIEKCLKLPDEWDFYYHSSW